MSPRKIRVLVVDDSPVVRNIISDILKADRDIELIGTAADPYIASDRLREEIPDVIILDIEMPRMDGLTFLRKLMSQHPIPVIICSVHAREGSETAKKAREYGAVEIIHKPRVGTKEFLVESKMLICNAVKAAAKVRPRRIRLESAQVMPKYTADAILPKPAKPPTQITEKVIVVGASTGGTEAIRVFLEAFSEDCPGIVIVQHMPEHFTAAFAERLNTLCRIAVKEAEDNDFVIRGRALIAPGNRHMLLQRNGGRYFVELREGPLVSRHRPSVDVLFRSAAGSAGKNAVGVILTGMGDDGATGMLEMKDFGAATIAQDEASCVVFGMPKEAIELGGVDMILPLEEIAPEILKRFK